MRKLFLLSFLCISFITKGQDMIEGYIINIENNQIYLDVTIPKVKRGDVLSIYKETGYMIHPVTKKKIKKEETILADLEIVDTFKEYSIATVYPVEAISKLKQGMLAKMPELPKGYNEEEISNNLTENAIQNLPKDAEEIINRYLQVAGLNKWMGKSPSYCVKKQFQVINQKGENTPYTSLCIANPAFKQVFVKIETPRKSLFLTYNYAYAINGNESWIKFKKGIPTKLKQENVVMNLEQSCDPLGLFTFDPSKWNRVLHGTRIEEGKNYMGIEFTSIKDGEKKIVYFSNDTGLISFIESKDGKVQVLDYQTYDGLTLCHTLQKKYSEGKISQEIEVLVDFKLNYPIDNVQFTKEAVKNAFDSK